MNDQPKSGASLPKAVHMQMSWMFKDLERMRRERQRMLLSHRRHADSQHLAVLTQRLAALDQALSETNELWESRILRDDVGSFDALSAYQDYGRFCYLLQNPMSGEEPSERTWKRFRQSILLNAAEKLYFV